jgi:hypothetical protein
MTDGSTVRMGLSIALRERLPKLSPAYGSNFSSLEKSPLWRTLRPNLFDAQVDILYLLRPNALRGNGLIQNRGHQLFWEQLIRASNGRFVAELEKAFDII